MRTVIYTVNNGYYIDWLILFVLFCVLIDGSIVQRSNRRRCNDQQPPPPSSTAAILMTSSLVERDGSAMYGGYRSAGPTGDAGRAAGEISVTPERHSAPSPSFHTWHHHHHHQLHHQQQSTVNGAQQLLVPPMSSTTGARFRSALSASRVSWQKMYWWTAIVLRKDKKHFSVLLSARLCVFDLSLLGFWLWLWGESGVIR